MPMLSTLLSKANPPREAREMDSPNASNRSHLTVAWTCAAQRWLGWRYGEKPTPSPVKAQPQSETQQEQADTGLSPIMGIRMTGGEAP